DVLAGARRTVHRADDGDVVARPVAEVIGLTRAAVVAQECAVFGRRRERGRDLGGVGVVALEGPELDVVDVDVLTGGDVAAGEADDLAVLADRVALPDRGQGELVAHLDRGREAERRVVEAGHGLRRGGLAGGRDVGFGAGGAADRGRCGVKGCGGYDECGDVKVAGGGGLCKRARRPTWGRTPHGSAGGGPTSSGSGS